MAIHDKLEVRIFVKGRPVHEYDVPEHLQNDFANIQDADTKPGPTVQACIESVPGENFAVECRMVEGFKFAPNEALSFAMRIDGKDVVRPLAFKAEYENGHGWCDIIDGASITSRGSSQKSKFRFESLRVDAGMSKQKFSPKEVAKIGSVQVVVRRKKVLKQTEVGRSNSSFSEVKVAEQHLKGRATDSRTR